MNEFMGMIRAAAVAFGKELNPEARPFYVAYLRPLSLIHEDMLPSIGLALGVLELHPLAVQFAEWGAANFRGDDERCQTIQAELNAAGVTPLALQALAAAIRFAALLKQLPPRTGAPN